MSPFTKSYYYLCFFAIVSYCSSLLPAQDRAGQQELVSRIDSFVSQTTGSQYAASVLVSVNGKVILQKGYGWTDSTKEFVTTEKTLFNIASITKSFTATAIFLLKQKGLLHLQDSLPQFFKNVPVEKKSITIEQLLLHTSGLAQRYLSDGIIDRDSAVSAIVGDTLTFSPGSGFSYANENYELLAAIIEVVTGKQDEEFVRENILKKAKMHDTRFWSEAASLKPDDVAMMNRSLDFSVRRRNWGYIGSAGIYTNVTDLYRWFTSLINENILDSENLSLMWSPRKKLSATSVAYGWYHSTTDQGIEELWTRGTEDWGHNGVLRWFPDKNTLVIVQTNSGEIGNDKSATGNRLLSDGIVKILFE